MIRLSDIYPVNSEFHSGSYTAGLLRSILMRSNFVMHQRQVLGWRGLRPACRGGDGWTCRIEGKEGVYGLCFSGEENSGNDTIAMFSICYFPESREEIIDQYSVQAALYTQLPQYNGMVRDFLSHPDFYRWFEIAELSVSVSADRNALWTNLVSQERMQISCSDELREWMGSSSALPVRMEELNQDLPAFDLAFPFFEVLVSTMANALECNVQKLVQEESGEKKRIGAGFGNADFIGETEEGMLLWERGSAESCGSAENRPFPDARWWSPMADPETGSGRTGSGRTGSGKTGSGKTGDEGIDCKPELIVLTGFLGSGKTTFLKQFIEYHVSYNRFVAVIQNEIGAQGLDGKLLEDEYAVTEMDEGCVCCSLIGQLKKGITNILDDHHPDIIILETTGLANPYNLLAELDEIRNLVHFESVITLVDGKNFLQSAGYSDIAIDQVKAADQLVLNKVDLLTEVQLSALIDEIRELNPDAGVHPCSFGKLNPSQLSGRSEKSASVSRKVKVHHDHETHHDHSEEGITSRKQIIKNSLDRKTLLSEMENLPESIYRVKGVVDIEGQITPSVLQYVNGMCKLEEMTHNIPKDRFLVFIGKSKALNTQSIFIN